MSILWSSSLTSFCQSLQHLCSLRVSPSGDHMRSHPTELHDTNARFPLVFKSLSKWRFEWFPKMSQPDSHLGQGCRNNPKRWNQIKVMPVVQFRLLRKVKTSLLRTIQTSENWTKTHGLKDSENKRFHGRVFIYRRIKKTKSGGRKCHGKTMMIRKPCETQRWVHRMCLLSEEGKTTRK